ncbi:MAG: hypothetical protein PHU49_15780 [Syntrophorhabdaceae bacterium]|nr:hypothetical protein [Syntrophorhabdaceae bacterium]
MHVRANDLQVLKAEITLPKSGPWVAKIEANGDTALSGTVTIDFADGSMQLVGTVPTGACEAYADRVLARIVGGAAGLQTTVGGKAYRQATAGLIIGDLLREAGEMLSTTSSATALATVFPHWVRLQNPAQRELALLIRRLGVGWRVLADGTVWVGTDAWAESALVTPNYHLIENIKQEARAKIVADVPCVFPGETFLEQHIATVEHFLDGAKLTTMVHFDG